MLLERVCVSFGPYSGSMLLAFPDALHSAFATATRDTSKM